MGPCLLGVKGGCLVLRPSLGMINEKDIITPISAVMYIFSYMPQLQLQRIRFFLFNKKDLARTITKLVQETTLLSKCICFRQGRI